ncbi:YbjQ family protein [Paludibacter sp. 221]|uniref:YbjQ family protein n=1 Tax=Paludibacter sp. 221 TaxID=2302939 RepID=UPI0013D03F2F|nr:YbjQ family protein [Paludibacter sp. 221]
MNKITITTTNSIENSTIQKYIELISTNVVVGTNFFSDFGASFTDIFGGFSNTYQNKLQRIYKIAISNLKEEAFRLGANAIVSLKVDFDEISGKGKSMFMVSAVGMAVSVKYTKTDLSQLELGSTQISFNQLEKEITKRLIVKQLEKGELPTKEQWVYLMSNPIDEIIQDLLKNYLELSDNHEYLDERKKLLQENFAEYIKQTNPDIAINTLYSNISLHFKKIWNLLNRTNLFSPQNILNLIEENNLKIAIKCLAIKKEFYTKEDLLLMKKIIDHIDSLPDTGKIEFSKDGLLSKEKERYICQDGHKNNLEFKFCLGDGCGVNIKGLKEDDCRLIESYRLKVDSLDFLING